MYNMYFDKTHIGGRLKKYLEEKKMKLNKIRKQIVLRKAINDKLIELCKRTGYNQSQLIELGLKKLDDSFQDEELKKSV